MVYTNFRDFANTTQHHKTETQQREKKMPTQPVAQQVDFQQYFCFVLFICFGSSLKTSYYISR